MCMNASWKLPWYSYMKKNLCNQSTFDIFHLGFFLSSWLYSISQENKLFFKKAKTVREYYWKTTPLNFWKVQNTAGGKIITFWQIKEILWIFQDDPLALVVGELLTFSWCQDRSLSGLSCLEAESSALFMTNSTQQNWWVNTGH
jgi:hypothetical protein